MRISFDKTQNLEPHFYRMKFITTLYGALMFLSCVLFADDFKLSDGREYKGVAVSRAEPDGLVVVTDSGIEKLPFSLLPKEVQQKYNYNPQAANAYAQADAAAQHAIYQRNQEELKRRADLAKQQAVTEAAKAQDTVKHQESKVVAQQGTGLIVRPGSMSVDEIAESPFSLRGYAVQVTGIQSIDKQESAPGVYTVELWGNSKSLKAEMTVDQMNSISASKMLFVRVKEKEHYGSEIQVECLGSAVRYEGLARNPTFYWK